MPANTINKLYNFYINAAPTRILHGSNEYYIECNKQKLQTIHTYIVETEMLRHNIVVHIQLQDKKIPKWNCILNCCAEYPVIKAPYLESSEKLDRLFPGSLHKIKFHIFYNIFQFSIHGLNTI